MIPQLSMNASLGYIKMIPAASAIAPYSYYGGFKFDANGYLVIA